MKHLNISRFFSDLYDSVKQRGFPEVQRKFPKLSELYIARLRFDALLSKTIVMTDAQLLDGAFMLGENPSELNNRIARKVGEPMPIEVRARTENLSDALLAFVKNPKKENLNGFTFSSVENEEGRKSLKERLESTKIGEAREWKDILTIMKSSGVDYDNLRKIEQGWANWIEAQKNGMVVVRKWEGRFNLDASLRSLSKPELTTAEGRDTANWVYERRNDRNSIDIRLNELEVNFRSNHKEAEVQDILSIKSWLYSAYNHALSRQHGCGNFESIFGMSSASPQLVESEKLGLPEHFWEKLATMPAETFKTLFWRNSEPFDEWWSNGNLKDLKKGIEPFVKEIVKTRTTLDVSPLAKILYGAGGALSGALIGYIYQGFPGLLVGAATGGGLRPGLEQLTIYLHYRPVRSISRRIMKTAEERQKNAWQNNNN